jgi:ribosome-binding ATPase YchF (GTP1/OBG family)
LREHRRREVEEGKSQYLHSINSLIEENKKELRTRENKCADVENLIKERSRKLIWVEKRVENKLKQAESKESEVKQAHNVLINRVL